MHILLTGATGYIGKRLLPVLLHQGHTVTCCVRDPDRFPVPQDFPEQVRVFRCDLSQGVSDVSAIEGSVDAAYYLVHSLTTSTEGYEDLELKMARNFRDLAERTGTSQVIYLGGMANDEDLSEHLSSRKHVEGELQKGNFHTSILRAAIIVGSGSASFEIIRDLTEKLPLMITPRWVNTRCQPIAVRNVIDYLTGVLGKEASYDQVFDIGGPNVLTYKEMMLGYARVRGLKRFILEVPVMTPRLSSYWLYFITATNYTLAVNLVQSMRIEVVSSDERIRDMVNVELIPYEDAVRNGLDRIEQNMVLSSWKDALSSSLKEPELNKFIQVPSDGCYVECRNYPITTSKEEVEAKVRSIGGANGWYYGNLLWRIRGLMDRLIGGVGLRRGKTNADRIQPGDALDFWRVLAVEQAPLRVLLYAEMKVPGDAWLEFRIEEGADGDRFIQKASFRPKGLAGRLYWYLVSPFHYFVFRGMARRIAQGALGSQDT
ncbi:MAG: SDR family oxidoreductase [Flavobacteriales bacterium]